MRRLAGTSMVALAAAALLASLSLVTWRQARALEALEALDEVKREMALSLEERAELQRRVQYLQSRGRVEPEARSRLGMKRAGGEEIVILQERPGEEGS